MLPRSQRSTDGRALLLAGALHGAVLMALWGWGIDEAHRHAQLAPGAVLPPPTPIADEVDVEVDAPPLGQVGSSIADRQAASAPLRSRGDPNSVPQRAGSMDAPPVVPLVRDGEHIERATSAENSPPTPAQESTQPTRAVDLGLGSGDWRRWLSETKSDPPTGGRARRTSRALFRAPPVSSTGGLQEGLEARDRALGLGTSGPVVSALYHAAHTEAAPFEGRARFRITVLKTGEVEVAVSEVSGDLAGWRAVADNAAEALRRSPPRIPNPRTGARLVVEITAKHTYPNGLQPKELYGLRPQVEPLRLRAVQDTQRELADRNPVLAERAAPGQTAAGSAANVNLPGVYLAGRGKVCSYRLGLTLLGLPALDGGCDPSNLGARPQRLVSTLVREETLY